MRFSEQWLREWIDPAVGSAELAEQLTLAGLEVDSIEPAAPDFSGVWIATVEAVEPHPESDRLRVCQVTAGGKTSQRVVCGAPNVRPGLRAPLAVVGARLPGDRAIERTAIQGVASEGMLCSAAELGLAEAASGLLELPNDAPPGTDFRDWAALADTLMELELTPNRGDCLSVRGIAREVAVAFGGPMRGPACSAVEPVIDDSVSVTLQASDACPRYAGRVIRGLDASAPTPWWLGERLRRSGIRAINPVVDVTNYVMLELGQPMHAFDCQHIDGAIEVRFARAGEQLTVLDGREVELDDDTLVIADRSRPLAVAGIMGGAPSAVDESTTDVFLESACFLPAAMAGRARRYGMHTDSSHRFERGVDPELASVALERATELLCAICGGTPGPARDTVNTDCLPSRTAIHLRASQVERLLGFQPEPQRIETVLTALGLQLAATEGTEGWWATPPSWRFDLAIEADLIEEIARTYGYNRAPRTHPAFPAEIAPTPERQRSSDELRNILIERDYHEAITYSFIDSALQQQLTPDSPALPLTNPISSDMDVMRTSLWPGLIESVRHNVNRQQSRVRLFEIGLRFLPAPSGTVSQETALGLIAAGPCQRESWDGSRREVDFFDIKGDIEALLDTGQGLPAPQFETARHPALHPGQSARIRLQGEVIGWLGTLHPRIQAELDLGIRPILAELALEPMLRRALPEYRAIPRHPSIRRDIAVIVDEQTPAETVRQTVLEAGPDELEAVFVFDVYQGQHIDSGRKSFALGLILQGFGRTLTDHEVEMAVDAIVRRLQQELGATLRE